MSRNRYDSAPMGSPRRLTAKRISQAKALHGDCWLSDSDGYNGYGRLLVRITPSGARRFYFRITINGKTRTVPIGRYSKNPQPGMFTLKQARARARDLGLVVRPQESQQPPSRSQPPSQVGELVAPKHVSDSEGVESAAASLVTVEMVCEAYVQHLTSQGKSSAPLIAGIAKRHVYTSAIAHLPADIVTAEQVSDVLRAIYGAGLRRTVSHVRSLLHAAYNFALRAKLNPKAAKATAALSITANPVSAVASLSDLSQPRERALDRAELGELMRFVDLSPCGGWIAANCYAAHDFLGRAAV